MVNTGSLRGLNKGEKKETYIWNKAKMFSTFPAYTDASSCKIVVALQHLTINDLPASLQIYDADIMVTTRGLLVIDL